MKLKVCKWIDSNIWGGLLLIDGEHCYACCIKPNFYIFDDNRKIKFKDINVIELQKARKKLLQDINNGVRHECDNCEFLVEKEESDINVGPLSYLSIANFKTCNLRCKYCYYTHEELGEKLLEEDTYIFPILKNFYNNGAIKRDGFCNIVKLIKIKNKNKTTVTLDKDLRTNGNEISDKMLEAAGKIYYICKELLKVDVNFIGGGLVENSKVEVENIEKIKAYSNFDKSKYIYMFDLEKILKRINNIDRISWWIPIRKWRDNFRNKMLNTDQTRPDQTRPDQTRPDQTRPDQTRNNNICLNYNIITNKLQPMLQYNIAA